jgi:hypothetical protein
MTPEQQNAQKNKNKHHMRSYRLGMTTDEKKEHGKGKNRKEESVE